MLSEEAKNDPIKKANTVLEIIDSISKIPNVIKQEIYIRNCASIMEISEEALFSALAQLNQKNKQIGSKKIISKPVNTPVKKNKYPSLES